MSPARARDGAGVGDWSRSVLSMFKPIRYCICCQLFSAGLTVLVSPRPNQGLCNIMQGSWVVLDLGRTESRASKV